MKRPVFSIFLRDTLAPAVDAFWREQPALLYGLCCLIGCSAALTANGMLVLPLFILFGPYFLVSTETQRRLLLAGLILLTSYSLVWSRHQLPELPSEGIAGSAEITISSLSYSKTAFGPAWRLKGELQRFTPDMAQHSHLEVRHGTARIILPASEGRERPQTNGTYIVKGKLTLRNGSYVLSVKPSTRWHAVSPSWNLVEWRYLTKQRLLTLLEEQMGNSQTAGFLAGLVTGDFADRQVAAALGRFGLQHIMAISGFHFAIVAGLCSLFLGMLLPRHWAAVLLIALLCSYFIFLGPGPSIMRAWIGALAISLGRLLGRRCSGLNALGIALMVLLFYDPLVSQTIAFQLSFLATAAILLFLGPMEQALRIPLPKRPLRLVATMHGWDQHGVLILALFRGALALTLAVHMATLPVTLYYFHQFPWLSVAYNLFFPFLVSISLLLLLLTLPLQLVFAPLASAMHALNSAYTQMVLNLAIDMPTTWDITWRISDLPTSWVIAYISLLGVIGVGLAHHQRLQRDEQMALAYL